MWCMDRSDAPAIVYLVMKDYRIDDATDNENDAYSRADQIDGRVVTYQKA